MSIQRVSDEYFDQFTTGKYHQGIGMRWALRNFMKSVQKMYANADNPQSILDVGCGEGFVSGFLSKQYPDASFSGVDIDKQNIEGMARLFPKIEGKCSNLFYYKAKPKAFDLIICCEVLEHLDEPEEALQKFVRMQPKDLIISVPNEPWFRLVAMSRGKNLKRFGNPTDHVNHWNRNSFNKLISKYFDVEQISLPYPWLMVHAKAKKK